MKKDSNLIAWFLVTAAGAIVGAIAVEAYRKYKDKTPPQPTTEKIIIEKL